MSTSLASNFVPLKSISTIGNNLWCLRLLLLLDLSWHHTSSRPNPPYDGIVLFPLSSEICYCCCCCCGGDICCCCGGVCCDGSSIPLPIPIPPIVPVVPVVSVLLLSFGSSSQILPQLSSSPQIWCKLLPAWTWWCTTSSLCGKDHGNDIIR